MSARNESQKKRTGLIIFLVLLILGLSALVFFIVYDGAPKEAGKADEAAGGSFAAGTKIVIDPGHGGEDPGCLGDFTGIEEAQLNLEIAKRLEAYLTSLGVEVVMTRQSADPIAPSKDEDMALRRKIISESGQDITVSIHQNHFDKHEARGPQVFYLKDNAEGERLANALQDSLNKALDIEKPRSSQGSEFYIVKSGTAPAVIVECGFLSNEEEEALLKKSAYQIMIVKAIAEGLSDYLGAAD